MMTFYLTGLDNLGNTCYMNTTLQALYATQEFREYMTTKKSEAPLHCALSKLFKQMMTTEHNCVSPSQFRSKFTQFKPQFKGRDQHDAQELLRFIIDGIHEEANEAKKRKRTERHEIKTAAEGYRLYVKYIDDSFLVKLFVGQLSSTIKCTDCGHESYCWDTFWDISLPLPEGNKECDINDCLKGYTAEEVLDNDSMPTCSQCNRKTRSIKSLQIVRSPLVLIIQLKKFGNEGQKISRKVTVNEYVLINSTPYRLYACICHRGDYSGSGHYTIFCRYESPKWYLFDDETLKVVQNFTFDQLNGAYILFYHMNAVSIKC